MIIRQTLVTIHSKYLVIVGFVSGIIYTTVTGDTAANTVEI